MKLPTHARYIFLAVAIALFASVVFISNPAETQAAATTFEYVIDRSAVPELNYTDITLIVNVSDATSIAVTDAMNNPIPYKNGPAADQITFTTTSNSVTVILDGMSSIENIGEFRKANLKDNYAWAYSHGFDDNFALDEARQLFLDRNIPATFNVVSDWVYENEFWSGDFSPAEFAEIVAAGWDINNHTIDHETADGQANGCSDTMTRAERKQDVLTAQTQIKALLADSTRPDYKIIGFAIPCGGSAQWAHYPGIVHEIRDNGENELLYYEGGQDNPVYMDITPPFDFNRYISRDGRIDGSGADASFLIDTFDEISNIAQQSGTPIWHTTISHGSHLFGPNETALAEMLDYLISTYGSNGTDEVWIAGTATVYSYLLVRDKSVVTQTTGPEATATPTSEPTATASPTQPAAETATPAPSVTFAPTETQEPVENDIFYYLPLMISNN